MKLGLEGFHCLEQTCRTSPAIFILLHFLLNSTGHLFGALASTLVGERLQISAGASSFPPKVKTLVIMPFK